MNAQRRPPLHVGTILIADDSAIVRSVLRKAIAISGMQVDQVVEAADGQEALAALGRTRADVVLADVNMPVLSGPEMVKRMRNDPSLSAIPVIIVSSERSEVRMEELRRHGAAAYVTKPFRPEQIEQALREVLAPAGGGHAI